MISRPGLTALAGVAIGIALFVILGPYRFFPPDQPDQTVLAVYPDHSDLGVYREPGGDLLAITEPSHWNIRRQHIIAGAQRVMGPLPDLATLAEPVYEILQTTQGEGYTRHTIQFSPETGRTVSAYLYEPHGPDQCKLPGMVALHQTHKSGKEQVDGHPTHPNLAYGRELAQKGYVVIAPDYPSFGDSTDHKFGKDGYQSGTMLGIVNHVFAVNLLSSHPRVDRDRIGAIGHSLGGHNAIFLGVFDPRIKVVVASASWTPFHYYHGGDLSGWAKKRYMPLIGRQYENSPDQVPFDFPELVAALAPRPFYSNSPKRDFNFSVEGVKNAMPQIESIYRLYGAGDHLKVIYPEAGHDFPDHIRQDAYDFIDRFMKTGTAGKKNSIDAQCG